MAQPTAKQFAKALDEMVILTKQRVRIGEIVYSTKKDSEDFDKRNWLEEAMEELADLIAYAVFCYMQIKSLYQILRKYERILVQEDKEIRRNGALQCNVT